MYRASPSAAHRSAGGPPQSYYYQSIDGAASAHPAHYAAHAASEGHAAGLQRAAQDQREAAYGGNAAMARAAAALSTVAKEETGRNYQDMQYYFADAAKYNLRMAQFMGGLAKDAGET